MLLLSTRARKQHHVRYEILKFDEDHCKWICGLGD